jgi:KDO2-lipid IV(A) lauroyltransferase
MRRRAQAHRLHAEAKALLRGTGDHRQSAPSAPLAHRAKQLLPSLAMGPTHQTDPGTVLPSHWGRRQRIKNTCIYWLARALAAALACVPYFAVSALAQALGTVACLVAHRERRRAIAQLKEALPDLPLAEVKAQVRAMFVHLTRSVLEMGHLPRLLNGRDGPHLSPAQRAIVDAAMAEGRGVIAITGHIGNWELLAQAIAHAGYPAQAVARPLYDPRMTQWVDRLRRVSGLGVIWRGKGGSVKHILRAFRSGGMLALLIDQDTPVEGVFVPFFGRPAHTPTAAASLALRFNAPMLVFYTHRVGSQHTVHVERIAVDATAPREAETMRLTAAVTAKLEAAIRQVPSQWVWLHARWKRKQQAD